MIKRLIVTTVLLLIVLGLTAPASFGKNRRLRNGYALEPRGTGLVTELAKFFKGYTRLKKDGSGCTSEIIQYAQLDSNDKFFQWVVKQADREGNHNGIAEVGELQTMWNTACTNRGE